MKEYKGVAVSIEITDVSDLKERAQYRTRFRSEILWRVRKEASSGLQGFTASSPSISLVD